MPPAATPAPCWRPFCEAEAAAPVVRELGLRSHRACGATPIPARSSKRHAGGRRRARPRRARPLRAPDGGLDTLDAEASARAGARSRGAASPPASSTPQEAHMAPADGHALPARRSAARGRRGRLRHDLDGQSARPMTSSSTAAASARAASCRPARRARRAPRRAHARGRRCGGRCGCCIRAIRSTSCRGATACTWSAPPSSRARTPGRSPCARRSSCSAWPTRCIRRFGEAEIVELGAGVRPAFADNVPKIVVRGSTIHVNGLYRHGFLMAPGAGRAGGRLPGHRRDRQPGVRDGLTRSCHPGIRVSEYPGPQPALVHARSPPGRPDRSIGTIRISLAVTPSVPAWPRRGG